MLESLDDFLLDLSSPSAYQRFSFWTTSAFNIDHTISNPSHGSGQTFLFQSNSMIVEQRMTDVPYTDSESGPRLQTKLSVRSGTTLITPDQHSACVAVQHGIRQEKCSSDFGGNVNFNDFRWSGS
jgi:hypothetical protein